MAVEWIIAFYMLVCLMMTVFNFVFLGWERFNTWRMERYSQRMSAALQEEIARNLEFPTDEHRQMLESKLKHLSGMESFDKTMERLMADAPEASDRYLRGIVVVFGHLSNVYTRRNDLRRAYFAEMVGKWYRGYPAGAATQAMLAKCIRDGSFYVRQNALEAMAQVSLPADLAESVVALDRTQLFHHRRLITEALLSFQGDKEALADQLVKRLPALSAEMRVAIVNYLRMAKVGRFGEDGALDRFRILVGLLSDEGENMEVRLACARYFGANVFDAAYTPLCEMALCAEPEKWEYAAVAATALAAYRDPVSVGILKKCLSSPVYFVRRNAADSLHRLGLSPETDLRDVLEGPDRYAREMIMYRWGMEGGAR